MITKESTLTLKPKPSPRKKTRNKLRKQKYLSLKLQLTATQPQPQPPMPMTNNHQLINLFPLHPEHLVEQDKLDMSCIFSSCDDDGAATTLTGLLSSDEEDIEVNTNTKNGKNMDSLSPSSANFADEEREERDLVRTAMRRNKSDNCYEKWVSYNEVVERKKNIKGISSSSSSTTSCYYNNHERDHNNKSKLVLKLDYEKIMKSWVNKGPLYICDDSGLDGPLPQTVPDIRDDDFFLSYNINGITHEGRDKGANEGSWVVPKMTHIGNNDTCEGDDALGSGTIIHNREASVQRYKEKRRNRLFAKTIRYEVRKLNAEKRPRIKGRFVKRN